MARTPRTPPRGRPAGPRPCTSLATLNAATAVLEVSGWTLGTHCRLRRTEVSRDEVLIAPIVGGVDTAPGGPSAEWRDQDHKRAWFAAAYRLRDVMTAAGWTALGGTDVGTYYRRPADDPDPAPAVLASAPPGAPVRLLAIAADLGVGEGDLDAAVDEAVHEEAAQEYNNGAHPDLDEQAAHEAVHAAADARASAINNEGPAAQLAFLYQGCVSETAFRSLLNDLRR